MLSSSSASSQRNTASAVTVYCRVFSQHVISDFGLRHGPPHRRPGLGHRVAAEVHHPGPCARSGVPGSPGVVVAPRGAPAQHGGRCISRSERFDAAMQKFQQNPAGKCFQRHCAPCINMLSADVIVSNIGSFAGKR